MNRRSSLCLAAAAACCCLALLARPVHGGCVRTGLVGASGAGGRDLRLSDEPQFLHGAHHQVINELQRGATKVKAPSSWSLPSPPSAGRLRAEELRSVPGGPDPLHHHGSPWRPEQEKDATP